MNKNSTFPVKPNWRRDSEISGNSFRGAQPSFPLSTDRGFEPHLPLTPASRRGLGQVRVSGSVARGDAADASDADLLMVPGPDTTLFHLSGFVLEVEEIVGRHVDGNAARAEGADPGPCSC